MDDVSQDRDAPTVTHILSHLNPYTQYAFYVKTYTIANEQHGAQSGIQYLRTLPAGMIFIIRLMRFLLLSVTISAPSPVTNAEITTDGSNSIYITWEPPLIPNGNVTYYRIAGNISKSTIDKYKDYCNERKYTNPL